MKGYWVIPVVCGIALMMMLSVLPAMATHSDGSIVVGSVISINNSDKHGTIEHLVRDGSGGFTPDGIKYQYRIPQDLLDSNDPSTIPEVGDAVLFLLDPENSRHATDVRFTELCPPNCFPPGGF